MPEKDHLFAVPYTNNFSVKGQNQQCEAVRPLAHHKYSNELNKKDIYSAIRMVKFLHAVCLQIKCIFGKRDVFRNQNQGRWIEKKEKYLQISKTRF